MRPFWRALTAIFLSCVFVLGLTSITIVGRAADSFSFTTIDFPNANQTAFNGINGSGQIVGDFIDPARLSHGFLRTAAGAFTAIDVHGGLSFTTAWGINNAGQTVGQFADAGTMRWHGFLRTPEGVFTPIDVPDAHGTYAFGINDAGQIVGYFYDTGQKKHGFLRTATGAFSTIDIPGATDTEAWGINGTGQIVGTFDNESRGFLRATTGTFTIIDVHGETSTRPSSINGTGEIVGTFFVVAGGTCQGFFCVTSHGFLRASTGAFTTIDVPGAKATYARGINDAGQIVGGFLGADGKRHGFVATR